MLTSITQGSNQVNFAITDINQPVIVEVHIENLQVASSQVLYNGEVLPNSENKTYVGDFSFEIDPTKNSVIEIDTVFHDINPDTNEVYYKYTIKNASKKLIGTTAKTVVSAGSLYFESLFIYLL